MTEGVYIFIYGIVFGGILAFVVTFTKRYRLERCLEALIAVVEEEDEDEGEGVKQEVVKEAKRELGLPRQQ